MPAYVHACSYATVMHVCVCDTLVLTLLQDWTRDEFPHIKGTRCFRTTAVSPTELKKKEAEAATASTKPRAAPEYHMLAFVTSR